jgi:hypothetical protein
VRVVLSDRVRRLTRSGKGLISLAGSFGTKPMRGRFSERETSPHRFSAPVNAAISGSAASLLSYCSELVLVGANLRS